MNHEQSKDLLEGVLKTNIKKTLNQIANDSVDASRKLHNLMTDNLPEDIYDPEHVSYMTIQRISEELFDLALELRLDVKSYNMLRSGRS